MAEPCFGIGGVEPFPRRLPAVEGDLAGCKARRRYVQCALPRRRRAIDPMEDSRIATAFPASACQAVTLRALQRSLSMNPRIDIELDVNGERHRFCRSNRARPWLMRCANSAA